MTEKLKLVSPETAAAAAANEQPQTIAKPSGFSLEKFKSKRAAVVANVETLQGALPHYPIAGAKDFVRLHKDEEKYWSPELCFVVVPIKGQKRDSLHLIDEDLALQYLESGKILRFRLALATKPHDVFFLCHIPSQNLDNAWNVAALSACDQAKERWVQVTSRKAEGVESYKISYARDADCFPDPKWPWLSLSELIETAFSGRMIISSDHPALLRLLGAKQAVS
jgi:hypothetical protein